MIKYHITSLKDLAEAFDVNAQHARKLMSHESGRTHKYFELLGEAGAWSRAAQMVIATVINDDE